MNYNQINLPENKFEVKYIGGHKAQLKSTDTKLSIYPDKILIEKFSLEIPYSKMTNIENIDTKQLVQLKRLLLMGAFAFVWKKKIIYTVIEVNDGLDTNSMVFEFGKNLEKFQPIIYERMIKSRQK